jgi:hypothetical protein
MYSLIVSVVTACYRKHKNFTQYIRIEGYSFFCSLVARTGGMMMNYRQTQYLWNTRAIILIRTDSLSYVKHVVRCYLKRTGRRLAALPAEIFKLQCHTDCLSSANTSGSYIYLLKTIWTLHAQSDIVAMNRSDQQTVAVSLPEKLIYRAQNRVANSFKSNYE